MSQSLRTSAWKPRYGSLPLNCEAGRIIPDDPAGKVSLMMSWAGESRDVADPWYTDDFEAAYRDILSACQSLIDQL